MLCMYCRIAVETLWNVLPEMKVEPDEELTERVSGWDTTLPHPSTCKHTAYICSRTCNYMEHMLPITIHVRQTSKCLCGCVAHHTNKHPGYMTANNQQCYVLDRFTNRAI